MNTDKNYEKDFEIALNLLEQNFSHDKLNEMLINGNVQEKQLAAINYDWVNDNEDATCLMKNLVGCDGKIREAVSYKLCSLIKNNTQISHFFTNDSYIETWAKATIDINGNICRNVIEAISILKYSDEIFAKKYFNHIVIFAKEALDKLDKFIFRDKKYTINKQIFKLYWCLEVLQYFIEYIDDCNDILSRSSKIQEYTIREKVAQIVILTNKLEDIKQILLNDENYYVKKALNHS